MFAEEWKKRIEADRWNWLIKTIKMHGFMPKNFEEDDIGRAEEMLARILTAACEVKLITSFKNNDKHITAESAREIMDNSHKELSLDYISRGIIRAADTETSVTINLMVIPYSARDRNYDRIKSHFESLNFSVSRNRYSEAYDKIVITW